MVIDVVCFSFSSKRAKISLILRLLNDAGHTHRRLQNRPLVAVCIVRDVGPVALKRFISMEEHLMPR